MKLMVGVDSGANQEQIRELCPVAEVSEDRGVFIVKIPENFNFFDMLCLFREKFGVGKVWQ